MYFIGKEDNDGNVTYLKWKYKSDKDGSYIRFSHELMKVCEKYQFALTEKKIIDKTKPVPCKSYCKEDYYIPSTGEYVETIERCNGTRERDECSCGGDKRKCNFYKYDEKTGKLL